MALIVDCEITGRKIKISWISFIVVQSKTDNKTQTRKTYL